MIDKPPQKDRPQQVADAVAELVAQVACTEEWLTYVLGGSNAPHIVFRRVDLQAELDDITKALQKLRELY